MRIFKYISKTWNDQARERKIPLRGFKWIELIKLTLETGGRAWKEEKEINSNCPWKYISFLHYTHDKATILRCSALRFTAAETGELKVIIDKSVDKTRLFFRTMAEIYGWSYDIGHSIYIVLRC